MMILNRSDTPRSVARWARPKRPEQLAVLEQYRAAWASNDAEALACCYTDDAIATLPGIVLIGKAAIRAEMTESFAGGLEGSQSVVEVHSVRRIGARGEVAIVTGRSNLMFAGSSIPHPATWAQDTWTLTLRGNRWLIDAHHCSLPDIA